MKQTKAARSRRVDPLPGLTLNLEIVGVALLSLAVLLALALALPAGRTGSLGPIVANVLRGGFGAAAWLAIALLAAVAAIVFLELHAMRRLALFALCAVGEFLVIAGWLGLSLHGGFIGNAIGRGFVWLLGPAGARVVFAFGALAFAVAPTRISLKSLGATISAFAVTAWSRIVATIAPWTADQLWPAHAERSGGTTGARTNDRNSQPLCASGGCQRRCGDRTHARANTT